MASKKDGGNPSIFDAVAKVKARRKAMQSQLDQLDEPSNETDSVNRELERGDESEEIRSIYEDD